MKLHRNIITPCLAVLFGVTALSGVMMYFQICNRSIKTVHEQLGIAFVLFSVLHALINWKALKTHFKKKTFIISGIVVLILSLGLMAVGKTGTDPKRDRGRGNYKTFQRIKP